MADIPGTQEPSFPRGHPKGSNINLRKATMITTVIQHQPLINLVRFRPHFIFPEPIRVTMLVAFNPGSPSSMQKDIRFSICVIVC